MKYMMALSASSVLPTWALDMTTTSRVRLSDNACMGSRMNSARLVFQRPGSADVSELSRRRLSAYSSSVNLGGGDHAFDTAESSVWHGLVAETFETFDDGIFDDLLGFVDVLRGFNLPG